jgi:hypothetical protein
MSYARGIYDMHVTSGLKHLEVKKPHVRSMSRWDDDRMLLVKCDMRFQ